MEVTSTLTPEEIEKSKLNQLSLGNSILGMTAKIGDSLFVDLPPDFKGKVELKYDPESNHWKSDWFSPETLERNDDPDDSQS